IADSTRRHPSDHPAPDLGPGQAAFIMPQRRSVPQRAAGSQRAISAGSGGAEVATAAGRPLECAERREGLVPPAGCPREPEVMMSHPTERRRVRPARETLAGLLAAAVMTLGGGPVVGEDAKPNDARPLAYPKARKAEVVDDYHGTR